MSNQTTLQKSSRLCAICQDCNTTNSRRPPIWERSYKVMGASAKDSWSMQSSMRWGSWGMGCSCEPPREWRLFWLPATVRCAAWLVPPLKSSLQLWEDTEGLMTRLAYAAFFSQHQHMYTLMVTAEHGEHSLIMRSSEHNALLPGELWLKHVTYNLSLAGMGIENVLLIPMPVWIPLVQFFSNFLIKFNALSVGKKVKDLKTLIVWQTLLPVYKAPTLWKNLLLLASPFSKCVLKQSERIPVMMLLKGHVI